MNNARIVKCDLNIKDPTREHSREEFSAIAMEFLKTLEEFSDRHGINIVAGIGSLAAEDKEFLGACAVLTSPAKMQKMMEIVHDGVTRFMEINEVNRRLSG